MLAFFPLKREGFLEEGELISCYLTDFVLKEDLRYYVLVLKRDFFSLSLIGARTY